MTQQNNQQQAFQLRNRYVFRGQLTMRTGLHIGGGRETLSNSDSPVVLTPDGLPFIPGSSFKGALRSTTEKLVASLPAELGLHTCGLPVDDVEGETCPTAQQNHIRNERRDKNRRDQEAYMQQKRKDLCHTCQLFGSPFAAARIIINDLYLAEDDWSGPPQIRDGVAIERDRDTAKRNAKYDFEVVPATTSFKLEIVIENATFQDLQLISIGLGEFTSGFGGIGGLRSRGLGACILENLEIRYLELDIADQKEKMRRLQHYLLHRDEGLTQVADADAFLAAHIKSLFKLTSEKGE
ncbi:CRISPR-associated RAMP protein (TIGR02581 family) [Thermosporothrix hazakensis]|jgi:CRISPR-associated RAMP protein (TIGR02581 family)|uniref:CRISPR-associated RAMP protein (TIGR02581 family) n=2 Tax=Thermosporothrix TaxID=768650 RepID=A0A326U9T6_THEHA|nr:CRISPR-associated RAMP protein Csx7 [Thermosporothrix hazakensis]PZW32800.1 CRISPR-associated RAMP protein (TIGR02581 family) [Thermosporothrix hazakensis]BBH87718.1 CRISPR-associated RAMP protein [Thermosporothrix sp. COM3]GCE50156.1 CRISPR-associated RAMP protein [Thermosporothrix hazakensis]